MTYREVFLAAFPRAALDDDDVTPSVCRAHVFGSDTECRTDPSDPVGTRCAACWAEECRSKEGKR